MKRLGTWLVAGVVAASLLGCQKEDPATKEKLDKIATRLDAIEKKIDQVAAGGGRPMPGQQQPGQRPGQPDPMAVYSVPIDNDPIKGNPAALVTIVEAAEFA